MVDVSEQAARMVKREFMITANGERMTMSEFSRRYLSIDSNPPREHYNCRCVLVVKP